MLKKFETVMTLEVRRHLLTNPRVVNAVTERPRDGQATVEYDASVPITEKMSEDARRLGLEPLARSPYYVGRAK